MTDNKPEEKIYITYKTRMATEVRLRRTALLCHIMLGWYSFCFIILSFLDVSGKFTISNSAIVSAVGSTAMFALSLFIYGERYSERANEFKNCYLKLQELYEKPINIDRKMALYAEILDRYENQSDGDYDDMLVDAWFRGQALSNARGPLKLSFWTFFKVMSRRLLKAVLIAAFLLAPIAVGIFWIRPAAL